MIQELASNVKMKVNERKTQMLCINASKFNEITSYIRTKEGKISSTDRLKILGFTFDNNPTANCHVEKFYCKLWMLRFLKQNGMRKHELLKVYKSIILPSVEYCSIVYNSLIPQYLEEKLELMQKRAMKIIYGYGIDYEELMVVKSIETLKARRAQSSLRFALKNKDTERFKKWFPLSQTERVVRQSTHRKYLEKQAKTERTKNNPIQCMIRLLNKNEHEANIPTNNI